MAAIKTEFEHGVFSDGQGNPFTIVEVIPAALPPVAEETADGGQTSKGIYHAQEIGRILQAAWQKKFARLMSPDEISEYIGDIYHQYDKMRNPQRDPRYLLAYEGGQQNDYTGSQAQALARVETYAPKSPFKHPYPNVTDVESMDGEIRHGTQYGHQAAALLYFALKDYRPHGRASAFTEAPNDDGIAFFNDAGFEVKNSRNGKKLPFDYIHMEATRVDDVRKRLLEEYDFLVPES